MKTLRLGLIGGNITQSRSPALQIVCGLSVGLNVSYDLLIPQEHGISFEEMLHWCEASGFDGVNVTYPYKEEALKHIVPGSAQVKALGACNTIHFSADGATAWNTDYTGFIAAYKGRFGAQKPGPTLIIGAGGVGRAIAFALRLLGDDEIFIHDIDVTKAISLCKSCDGILAGPEKLLNFNECNGIVNCTPLGMVGYDGNCLPSNATGQLIWAFDAVYTPEKTQFRTQMEDMGAQFLSGYELYFYQGMHGFEIFSGKTITRIDWVRSVLQGQ